MFKITKEFLTFLRKPYYINTKDRKVLSLSTFFKLFSITLLFSFLILPVKVILVHLANTYLDIESTNTMIGDRNEFINSISWYVLIYLGAIQAPILEELSFRLFLIFNKKNISVALFSFLLLKLVLLPLNKSSFIEVLNLITILKVIGIPILVYFSLSLFKFEDLMQKYSTKYYSVFFYFVAFLFGIAHINGNLTIITILDILPQLFAGLIFGYIRVSYGIIAVIAIHMANNFIMILPKVIDKIM